ncbi:MAG: hypothetical protein B7Y11_05015 [Sphingobacteriia bacterium 24-36-13]|jgi:hypothetical protein|uniref:hypothetical protein n=1 Tax=Sediminibacterium sp. TaxID=1917865 RepID=UPI000BDB83CD|nr:hypothetical protein [Sediminibacterium sp.]OYZ54488.1 MAG: hypothetical protein B7Y11_05015 [Sphingobacteriia bacterium 24-36-13]OZA65491.1 MAG: hypothetical protein B7X68_03900 [Sphingobacteriia bacterium 39-36-14]HQS23885.1 hypothetical protein [Sediminibacterium sp.]HQS34441.1 hypothetical protein [Sediminibacterium sp.]
MKVLFSIFLFIPILSFSQLENVPLKEGKVSFEKVIVLDSINNKDLVFNAAKSALVRNANYKYSKIDEDRVAGNITTEITFSFIVNSPLGRWNYNAKSNLSIDVKENRFRIRLYNNTASFILMQQLVTYEFESAYAVQKEAIASGKYKVKKDNVTPWNSKLLGILEAFAFLVKDGIKDEF